MGPHLQGAGGDDLDASPGSDPEATAGTSSAGTGGASGSGGPRAGAGGNTGPRPRAGAGGGGDQEPMPDASTEQPGAGNGPEPGDPTLDCTSVWSSGFENGFPGGEWLDYDEGYFSEDGSLPDGNVAAWTIISRDSGEPVYSGDHAYKGWITEPSSESHRPYPVIHIDFSTPIVNTFMVYLEADYDSMADTDWIHFGTWGTEAYWALHTMSVRNRLLNFAHTEPFAGEYIGPTPQADFPRGEWVRLTVYIHYEGNTGFVQVWQDGVAMLRAEIPLLADNPTTRIERAHWGMYSNAANGQGLQYNDDIALWTLSEPLEDLDAEPDCYLAQ
jgi:hypothetical protein